MKTRHSKVVALMVVLAALTCVIALAARSEPQNALPPAVAKAITSAYPGAKLEEATVDQEEFKVYEVEVVVDGKEMELTISPDGTIMEVAAEMDAASLPPAVARAIAAAAPNAKINEVVQEVAHGAIKVVMLEKPATSYEAELTMDSQKAEIEVAADGRVIEQPRWKSNDDDEEDDDEDDNGGDEDDND